MSAPRFLDAGDCALVVEFGEGISPELNDQVLQLDAGFAAAPVPGVIETVPTFRSLMIHYEPLVLPRETLIAATEARLASNASASARRSLRAPVLWELPCCYESPLAEDMAEVCDQLRLTPAEVARLHCGQDYRIYMYGFVPGGSYLGAVAPELALSRRSTPRPPAPENALLLGGGMTALMPFAMPTGWYVIGQCPEPMFSTRRAEAFFAEPGDLLRFSPIDTATFTALRARSAAGERIARRLT